MNLFALRGHLKTLLLVLTFAALACALCLLGSGPPDPLYQDRPLSEWIALYGGRHGKVPPASEKQEAGDAIRHIGTNAIPSLLAWIAYEPAITRYHLMPLCLRLPPSIVGIRLVQGLLGSSKATERAQNAMDAFQALRSLAVPAIPELIRRCALNDSPATRDRAMLALAYIGPPAVPTLAALLSTPDGAADGTIMACVRALGTNAQPLVPILLQNLTQTNWFAVVQNARMLGDLKLQPDLVIPALTRCLRDPRREVRMEAPNALREFAELARQALPALTNALSDPDPDVRRNAATAIRAIAPPTPSTLAK